MAKDHGNLKMGSFHQHMPDNPIFRAIGSSCSEWPQFESPPARYYNPSLLWAESVSISVPCMRLLHSISYFPIVKVWLSLFITFSTISDESPRRRRFRQYSPFSWFLNNDWRIWRWDFGHLLSLHSPEREKPINPNDFRYEYVMYNTLHVYLIPSSSLSLTYPSLTLLAWFLPASHP